MNKLNHIAIIMDGNGRWGLKKKKSRNYGHLHGIKTVETVIKSSLISILVSIFVIFIISWYFFRALKWGLLAIVPLTCAVILNFGLMGLFGIKLSHITAILTAIIIGVGVDFAIHYISEFKRNLKNQIPLDIISRDNVDDVGYPILLDVVSNMGFAALLFSDLIPLNYMGGLMIFAMLSPSFGTFILMGTTIEIFNKKREILCYQHQK